MRAYVSRIEYVAAKRLRRDPIDRAKLRKSSYATTAKSIRPVSSSCNDLTLNLRFTVTFYRVVVPAIHQLHLRKISRFGLHRMG